MGKIGVNPVPFNNYVLNPLLYYKDYSVAGEATTPQPVITLSAISAVLSDIPPAEPSPVKHWTPGKWTIDRVHRGLQLGAGTSTVHGIMSLLWMLRPQGG